MQTAPPTPKGFRDINPELAKKRRKTINTIVDILEEFEFVPIETPTIEFAETLEGKYGEDEKLIYKFADRGGRNLALRYDLTVPLARYVATNNPPLPFRRYQTGQVFRGENPQHGRYREFTQLDCDTVGITDVEEDARIVACAIKATRAIGLDQACLLINDRQNFADLHVDFVRAIDKLYKIQPEGVIKELVDKGHSKDQVEKFVDDITNKKPTENLSKIMEILTTKYNLEEKKDFLFDPTLARGLDYYTGAIFELKPSTDPADLTIGSGGRYDNLIGMFGKNQLPAVGFSFGIDRIVDIIR